MAELRPHEARLALQNRRGTVLQIRFGRVQAAAVRAGCHGGYRTCGPRHALWRVP